MKKLLSLALVLTLMLSLGVSAFAQISGETENSQPIETSPVEGNAKWVKADANGDDLTVTGNVTGDSQGYANSVIAQNGAKITVGGEVTSELVWPGGAIQASNASTKVTVEGAVTEKTNGNAINASFGAAVEVGSVDEKNDGDAINASSGAVVEVGSVSEDGAGNAVSASGSDTKVTVNNAVKEGAEGSAISAEKGAEVTVKGYVSEYEVGNAISATEGATVTVENYVNEGDAGHAVSATEGANVTVKGNVNEKKDGNAVNATGVYTTVTVEGNVKEEGTGSAINVYEATVIIVGNVEEANAGSAITATNGANVIVGGNVSEVVETAGASDGVISGFGATVIVEGLVTGDLSTNGQTNSGTIYLGQLNENGNIKEDADLSKIHYLIGVATEGSAALSAVKLVSDIVAQGTIDGINEEGYRYTTTADTTALNGKTITLKPAEDGKILTVSGFNGANVTYVANEDGTVTFTIGDSFTGGLQNLVLVLADKPGPGPDPTPVPVIYVVPVGSITVVEFTAPEGVAEGLITKLDSADHAGLTLDKSLLAEGYDHSVKVTLNGEELPEGAYRFVINWDGSLSLILSTTYMKSLGNGSYDFLAAIDGLEIPFTVAVAE